MERIVTTALKIDFHIHSHFSSHKDPKITKAGTIQNLPIIFGKLIENSINMVSFTDHDCFSFELYKKAKEYEGKGTIKKVFPGVELSVGIKGDDEVQHDVHVIAIFDDSNENKVRRIEDILPCNKIAYDNEENGKTDNGKAMTKNHMFFSENKIMEILREIDLNVILIAHQKGSPSSKKARKDDASSAGKVKFDELLNYGYFEALEFKSMRNNIFNNLFKQVKNQKREIVKFITGSDCHDWNCYPKHDPEEDPKVTQEFHWTYLKCLPCFRGLAMSFTDDSRISLEDNFFNTSMEYLDNFKIKVNGKEFIVPLSRGINVIIGDNSVGKSLLVNKITNYSKLRINNSRNKDIKSGYEKFLSKNKIEIETTISDSKVMAFDSQGEIRRNFESGNKFLLGFIERKYPAPPDIDLIKQEVKNSFEPLYEYLGNRLSLADQLKELPDIFLYKKTVNSKNLSCIKIDKSLFPDERKYNLLVQNLKKLTINFNQIIQNPSLSSEDKERLIKIKDEVFQMQEKYDLIRVQNHKTREIIENINLGISAFAEKINTFKSQAEKEKQTFDETKNGFAASIEQILQIQNKIKSFNFDSTFEKVEIHLPINTNKFGDYIFVNKVDLNEKSIGLTFLKKIISMVLFSGKELQDLLSVESIDGINQLLKDNQSSQSVGVDLLKEKINGVIEELIKTRKSISVKGQDLDAKFSNGANSTIYFDLLSQDSQSKGIYIVDQPEDDVSQKSIRKELIPDFKKMSNNRQLIIVTHNPQLVVNLDADNVIYLFRKNNSDLFDISSGALEYNDEGTDILEIVADNLDGGIASINQRWNRYGKGNFFQ